jgi:predicted amidohydrolase YtcJ
VVIAVGDAAAVRDACDAGTEIIDAAGATLAPGLVDSHIHPFWTAEFAQGADCSRCSTLDDLRNALYAERERVGGAGIVRAFGIDYGLFTGSGLKGDFLEEFAGGDAFVTLFDCHTYVATPGVLARAGIEGPRRFADNSAIVCRGAIPTGELREFEAYDLIAAALPAPSHSTRLERIGSMLARMNEVGLTGAHMMDGSRQNYDDLRELEASGRLTVRLVAPLWIKPAMEPEELEALALLVHERGLLWRAGAAKFFVDGVVETGTAWLEEPDAQGDGTRPIWPSEASYADAVRCFAAAGFQCISHAIGDRAVRAALDAYAGGGAAEGVRHRVEHAETLADRELERLATEGVVCSMQPLHMQWRRPDLSDDWAARLGPARAARAYRARDVLDAGIALSLGSDWPVASFDPREGMAWARLRRRPGDRGGHTFEQDQRLSGEEALAGYTSGAAAAVARERELGRIAPGFHADFTGFAEDPVEVDADELPALPVVLTVVGGNVVHRKV